MAHVWKKLLDLISTTNKNSIRYSLLLLAQLYPSINFNDRGLVLALETTKLLSSTGVEVIQAYIIEFYFIISNFSTRKYFIGLWWYCFNVNTLIEVLFYVILFYFKFDQLNNFSHRSNDHGTVRSTC